VSRRKTKRGPEAEPESRQDDEDGWQAPFSPALAATLLLCPTRSVARTRSRLFGFMIIGEGNGPMRGSRDTRERRQRPRFALAAWDSRAFSGSADAGSHLAAIAEIALSRAVRDATGHESRVKRKVEVDTRARCETRPGDCDRVVQR